MDDLFDEIREAVPQTPLYLGTVGSVSASGATLKMDGDAAAGSKAYKHVDTGITLTAGDRVLVARISGSYVILGKITA